MKTIRFHETGTPDVLRLEDVAVPEPGPGQVRLAVSGAGVNPADNGMRGGTLPIPISLPHTPGYDVSGTVDAVGEGVTGWSLGDAVVAFLPMTDDGAAAEFALAPAAALVAAPTTIPLPDAAGLPSVALTAWQALFDEARIEAGQRVLIAGAGGPVGGYAVQLAHRAGAHVIATASPRSAGAVRSFGADEVIDHTSIDVRDAVDDRVDVLLNLAPYSPEQFAALVPLVKDGGVVVSTTAWLQTPDDPARGVRGVTVFVRSDAEELAQLVTLVDRGELTVDIAERIALRDLPAVHERIAAGALRGKVVVVPA